MTHRRFDRAARLVGDQAMERLGRSTVTVFGCGGVGSHAAEALVRSGVGRIVLVDFDRICVTNSNRQLHAMKGTLGKSKVAVMAERLRLINPDAQIEARPEFYSADTSDRLLSPEPDLVIDAIDNIKAKLHLLATCIRLRIPCISTMGAAARLDPTQVKVGDLCETRLDPFAKDVRKLLRKKHGIDATVPTGITAIWSDEPPLDPLALAYDTDGFECVCPSGDNGMHSCERKHRIEGSATFVPAAFGLTAASVAVRRLVAAELAAALPHRLSGPTQHAQEPELAHE